MVEHRIRNINNTHVETEQPHKARGFADPPVVKVVVTGSLETSPLLLEISDTLYSVSGLRLSMLYCLSGAGISALLSSDGSDVGP